MRNRARLAALKRITPLPLPPSLAQAFAELDSLDRGHPERRGTNYATIRQHEGRCHRSTMT
jgi:hypothetical protein